MLPVTNGLKMGGGDLGTCLILVQFKKGDFLSLARAEEFCHRLRESRPFCPIGS